MNIDFALLAPEFIVIAFAFIVLGADLILSKDFRHYLPFLGVAGLLVAIGSVFTLIGETGTMYGGIYLVDEYAIFFKVLFPIIGIVMLLSSRDFVKDNHILFCIYKLL